MEGDLFIGLFGWEVVFFKWSEIVTYLAEEIGNQFSHVIVSPFRVEVRYAEGWCVVFIVQSIYDFVIEG